MTGGDSQPLEIAFTPIACAQLAEAEAWWRANRPSAPRLLRVELDAALRTIALHPRAGARARSRALPSVRRVLLARSRYHLYYRPEEGSLRVVVLALWHASRGAGPRMSR